MAIKRMNAHIDVNTLKQMGIGIIDNEDGYLSVGDRLHKLPFESVDNQHQTFEVQDRDLRSSRSINKLLNRFVAEGSQVKFAYDATASQPYLSYLSPDKSIFSLFEINSNNASGDPNDVELIGDANIRMSAAYTQSGIDTSTFTDMDCIKSGLEGTQRLACINDRKDQHRRNSLFGTTTSQIHSLEAGLKEGAEKGKLDLLDIQRHQKKVAWYENLSTLELEPTNRRGNVVKVKDGSGLNSSTQVSFGPSMGFVKISGYYEMGQEGSSASNFKFDGGVGDGVGYGVEVGGFVRIERWRGNLGWAQETSLKKKSTNPTIDSRTIANAEEVPLDVSLGLVGRTSGGLNAVYAGFSGGFRVNNYESGIDLYTGPAALMFVEEADSFVPIAKAHIGWLVFEAEINYIGAINYSNRYAHMEFSDQIYVGMNYNFKNLFVKPNK